MTTIRMTRLDESGAPTGESLEVSGLSSLVMVPDEPDFTDCQPIDLRALRRVNLTFTIAAPKGLHGWLLGPRGMLKWRRAQRHRARIVVTPQRRRKHGRIGVYR